MLFNSLEFIVFFPLVVALYFAIPGRFRWILLLLASYYFYMSWNYKYIILIVFSTLVDYFAALAMGRTDNKRYRKGLLAISLISNLGLLFYFKYFNFFSSNVNLISEKYNLFGQVPLMHFLLPVGISFYTFQTLSYTIDVYWGKKEPEKHLGIFALYVAFFPQLVAGPIERSTRLLPQFYKTYKFDYVRIRNGLVLMIWGFFKKVVIADRLAEYVDMAYNNPDSFSGLQHLMATFFFGSQIYCDFSGYSDIAIGSAMVLGYDLMTNFRRPYLARSIREFWQRWHISLSTWFRDYLYIPLGGNRVVKWRWYYNLFITFLISGLWHGANWTFVIWGALHGAYLVLAIWTQPFRKKIGLCVHEEAHPVLANAFHILWTVVLVYFAWIFFRANSVSDAWLIIGKIADISSWSGSLQLFHFQSDLYLSLVLIGLLIVVELVWEYTPYITGMEQWPRLLKWVIFVTVILAVFILGKWEQNNFLYFQF
ncbi:MAG: MBOAT family protein [Bacteroidales bacterium]